MTTKDFTATEEVEIRRLALICATLHHGLSNLSPKAVPARTDTVLETAHRFEEYITNGYTVPVTDIKKQNIRPR